MVLDDDPTFTAVLDDADLYHVTPAWEGGHITHFYRENGPCWCGAQPDKDEPNLIIHNEGRIN